MTNTSAKDKRKKKRAQRLSEEEQQPVSIPHPLPTPTAPPATPSPPLHFPSPLPPPRDSSWYQKDDVTDIQTIYTVYTAPLAPAPRDFSALRSIASTHPWRTIRRRNHRLLPQRREPRPFPKSLPKRTVTAAPRADILAVHDHFSMRLPPPPSLDPTPRPAPLSFKEPVPVLVLPRPIPLPYNPYYFIPSDFPVHNRSLPAETFYGPVQSGLALVCAREYPWIDIAHGTISEIAWGVYPRDEYDERARVLDVLPPDELVFLMVLSEICRLELDFTGFVEPAIANFVNAWLDHCCSVAAVQF
ncbi:hypothetical protein B0H12DRAFT_1230186 [Mycena haematopus]|nr:hypothetical protein B0H12DRAFT_1230186 [Mycena haematopus]